MENISHVIFDAYGSRSLPSTLLWMRVQVPSSRGAVTEGRTLAQEKLKDRPAVLILAVATTLPR